MEPTGRPQRGRSKSEMRLTGPGSNRKRLVTYLFHYEYMDISIEYIFIY